jgi:hypothetical protein
VCPSGPFQPIWPFTLSFVRFVLFSLLPSRFLFCEPSSSSTRPPSLHPQSPSSPVQYSDPDMMNYRPHPFLLALFCSIFLFNSFAVCLYGMLVRKRGVSVYEVVHLIMSSISISAIFLLGIYLQYTRHRTKPFKMPYTVTFCTICFASLVGSISVSVKAGQNALCSVFSSIPSNQDCKWGGISIILPWVSAICGV